MAALLRCGARALVDVHRVLRLADDAHAPAPGGAAAPARRRGGPGAPLELGRCFRRRRVLRLPLPPLPHLAAEAVQDGVDGDEPARASDAGRAVEEHGRVLPRDGGDTGEGIDLVDGHALVEDDCLAVDRRGATSEGAFAPLALAGSSRPVDGLFDLTHQVQKTARIVGDVQVRPLEVLELRDGARRRVRIRAVRELEDAPDGRRVLVIAGGDVDILAPALARLRAEFGPRLRDVGAEEPAAGLPVLPPLLARGRVVRLDEAQPQRAVRPLLPVLAALDGRAFDLAGEHDDDVDVLFPTETSTAGEH